MKAPLTINSLQVGTLKITSLAAIQFTPSGGLASIMHKPCLHSFLQHRKTQDSCNITQYITHVLHRMVVMVYPLLIKNLYSLCGICNIANHNLLLSCSLRIIPPSDETVLLIFMSPPFKEPHCSYRRQGVLIEQPGTSLLLGSRISLVPLNNEMQCVPSVLIKTHGHSSI